MAVRVKRADGVSRTPPGAKLASVAAAKPPAKEHHVQITRNSIETATGPSDWFTGTVYVDAVAVPSAPSRLQAASVHFTPGARTAWHTHPNGQTIYVTEGVGLAQRRGGPIEVIRPGDRVFFEPGEDHWHGATPDRFMTHLAMQDVDDEGSPVTWGEHVTDEEYRAAPAS
jgi:quercetin dioxygenase-like cupin family protein